MRVSDYGGYNQDRNRASVSRGKEKLRSFRCLECNHITFYSKIQLARMRHAPHCIKCAGQTQETETSYSRNVNVNNILDTGKSLLCPVCQKLFRSSVGLKLHLEEMHNQKG
jgi:transcription elongation factor Elf1